MGNNANRARSLLDLSDVWAGMKTIEEWLEMLPEPYSSEALENRRATQTYILYDSEVCALQGAFDWHKTPQGWKYWVDLCQKLENGQIEVCETISKPSVAPVLSSQHETRVGTRGIRKLKL